MLAVSRGSPGRMHYTQSSAALSPGDALGQGWSCWCQERQHCRHYPAGSSALQGWVVLNRPGWRTARLQHTSYKPGHGLVLLAA